MKTSLSQKIKLHNNNPEDKTHNTIRLKSFNYSKKRRKDHFNNKTATKSFTQKKEQEISQFYSNKPFENKVASTTTRNNFYSKNLNISTGNLKNLRVPKTLKTMNFTSTSNIYSTKKAKTINVQEIKNQLIQSYTQFPRSSLNRMGTHSDLSYDLNPL